MDLIKAIKTNNIDAVKQLIASGIDVNASGTVAQNPLIFAISKGNTDIIKLLIDAGADVNTKQANRTALENTLIPLESYRLTAQALWEREISAPADNPTDILNILNDLDRFSSKTREKEILQLLEEQGVDVHTTNEKGRVVLTHTSLEERALSKALETIIKRLTEIAKLLIEAGADVNKTYYYNNTPFLIWLSKEGYTDLVKLFLENGADVNAQYEADGETSLIVSSGKGHADIVKLLLENGADVNAKDKDGNTALSLAKNKLLYNYHKYQEIIQLLKDAGATE